MWNTTEKNLAREGRRSQRESPCPNRQGRCPYQTGLNFSKVSFKREKDFFPIDERKRQYERVACRRSWAAALFKRWSLLTCSNDAGRWEAISVSSVANGDEQRGRVAMGLIRKKNAFSGSDYLHFPFTEVEAWKRYAENHNDYYLLVWTA